MSITRFLICDVAYRMKTPLSKFWNLTYCNTLEKIFKV
ncbi:hypothetical protein B4147_4603 [Bacillus wiedmannii]|uniref:Uncharacterized protein n=2 Tax=Bacillus cereus group TaxID=86661 RepID=A0A0G8EKS4_BACCE|nr:hypothetical protein B4147_4603 [Bacillus wiedmannii]KLA24730.1 hypothetical protein B4077_4726 [Bacillus cereus]